MGLAVRVSTSTPGGHLLHGLFVADAEALLLVDHEESQVLELDVPRQHPVRADHHVDRSRGQPGHDLARLGRGEKARQHLHPHGEPGVALGEGLGVLLGEQRGGDEHGGLLAVLDRLEHGPHRHLGLAEAHVATHQAVHGHLGLHVGLDLLDGARLVDGLGEGEGVLELALPRRVGREGVALHVQPAPVELDELLGDLVHRGARLGPRALPLRPAQAVQRGGLAPAVGGERVDLVRREVQLVVAAVLEQQVVAATPR